LVRYYGWYSNRSRGDRRKEAGLKTDIPDSTTVPEEIEALDVSTQIQRPRRSHGKGEKHKYSGHAVLMGKVKNDWQDTDCVLSLFAPTLRKARRAYEEFVAEGLKQKKGADLTGGGLVRSASGWAALAALRRKGLRMKADERILGSSDFVERVLKKAEEELSERTRLQQQGSPLIHS